MIDNHVRATVVFTGSYADDQIPYRLDLNSSTYLGTHVDRDFDSGQGIMHETRHDYYIRYVFDSDVHLIATDTSGSKPDPSVKPIRRGQTRTGNQARAHTAAQGRKARGKSRFHQGSSGG